MVTPADSTELRRLEGEAHECERKSDYLGALDVYDEIVSKGLASARHLAARGYCYMKDRQRQQAKKDWLDGLALDPDNKLCREALDKFFPGWESRKEPPRLLRDKEMAPPPPPPPADFGQEITVETTSTVMSQAKAHPAPVASEPPQDPRPIGRPSQPAARPQPAPARPAPAAARVAADGGDIKVNWEFVMQDAAEEAAVRRR